MKQLLHDFLSHPWVDCKEAADGADGRAECGKRGTSWRPSRYRYRKSATVTTSPPDVPVSLPSSIFDFVPGASPSWSSKVCVLHGHTPYVPTAGDRPDGPCRPVGPATVGRPWAGVLHAPAGLKGSVNDFFTIISHK